MTLNDMNTNEIEKDVVVKMEPKRNMKIYEWFKKGQMSVKRKNKSGCCCIINDNDDIISTCDAHKEWAKKQIDDYLKSLSLTETLKLLYEKLKMKLKSL